MASWAPGAGALGGVFVFFGRGMAPSEEPEDALLESHPSELDSNLFLLGFFLPLVCGGFWVWSRGPWGRGRGLSWCRTPPPSASTPLRTIPPPHTSSSSTPMYLTAFIVAHLVGL